MHGGGRERELCKQGAANEPVQDPANGRHGDQPQATGCQAAGCAGQPRQHPKEDDEPQVRGHELRHDRQQVEESTHRLDGRVAKPADGPQLVRHGTDQTKKCRLQDTETREQHSRPRQRPA
ncbi:MAG TPA: hypothetical protein VG276_05160 [Actinomycetes bacterium]|jgi:hypothetical protein|nr:hypothetical protein [Actinomycetes bacterium]